MHSFLIAIFFIAIVLSPCMAALWTLAPSFAGEERARTAQVVKAVEALPIAAPAAEVTTATAAETAEFTPTREGLLKCARSSQLRRFHIHQPGSAGEIKLRSLRPVA